MGVTPFLYDVSRLQVSFDSNDNHVTNASDQTKHRSWKRVFCQQSVWMCEGVLDVVSVVTLVGCTQRIISKRTYLVF